ncbi:PQQ-like beta-propeller repeat protein [Sulfitobacter sp. S190]|uniref:PQQ-like beta-propeller repeat protein n=1 Tax=Sulfitobacter sp. S190 TaxID=2867022 RepID=UPI0021A28ABE|nr:PQQ-like beta-propeller repeat protein [Sulfitobacter sp. S190]UWR21332.1 PQQ-like beta-propeller repeat protein [Sulfitobacter sp. S190]
MTVFPTLSSKWHRIGLPCVACAALLGACVEPDPILQGAREDVRAVLQNPDVATQTAPESTGNQSRPIALPAASTNANWTQTVGSPGTRVAHPALRATPQLVWSANIGQGDSRKQRITADPVVSDGRVFTLDAEALLTATSTSGATLWSTDLRPARDKEGEATGGGVVVADGTVYASLGYGVLAAVDAANGVVRWTQQLDATASGAPTVAGDLVYVTSGDDTGWAVNRSDGRVRWQINASDDASNVLGAPAPAISGDLAVFAFGSGEVQGVFRQGGLNRWDASVLGKRPGRALSSISDVTSAPVISGDTVYVGNQSGRIVALGLASGARRWTAREGAVGPVWPAGDSVFAVTDLNELVRLDATDGSRIWGVELPNYVKRKPRRQSRIVPHNGPIIAGARVYVASGDGLLRSFDPTNGAALGTVEIAGGATTAPVVAGGTLYVVSSKGQLLAYR